MSAGRQLDGILGGDRTRCLARAYYAAGQASDAVALLRDSIARSEQALSPPRRGDAIL